MSVTFTKLFSSITASTIWCESSNVRIVWVTMLAMADRNGRVFASVPGLARLANVPTEECRVAISKFLAPDPDSRTPDNEGRRIEPIDGGWRLLNHEKYRAIRDEEAIKKTKRDSINAKRAKDRAAASVDNVDICRPLSNTVDRSRHNAEAEAEAYTEAEAEAEVQTYVAEAKRVNSKPLRAALALVEIPSWLNFEDWEAYRAHRGPKFTAKAQDMAIKQLDVWRASGQDPGAILRQSVMNGWKGLFELKGKNRVMPDLVNGLGPHGQATAAAGKAWLESTMEQT